MAQIKSFLRVDINTSKPVVEVCQVISAIMPFHLGNEEAILKGIRDAIDQRLTTLKGDNESEQIRKFGAFEQNQRRVSEDQ